jgi:hypothetical protein
VPVTDKLRSTKVVVPVRVVYDRVPAGDRTQPQDNVVVGDLGPVPCQQISDQVEQKVAGRRRDGRAVQGARQG